MAVNLGVGGLSMLWMTDTEWYLAFGSVTTKRIKVCLVLGCGKIKHQARLVVVISINVQSIIKRMCRAF